MHTPPILLPDVHTFGELLTYCGEWDNVDRGFPEPHRPPPRYIPETTPAASDWERAAWRGDGRNEIGPYCTIDLSQLGGPRHRGIAVRATDAVMEAVAPRIVTPDDHLSFRIIGHAHTGRALVILQHGYIIGSHWLAHIDPDTLPDYPYAARDARAAEITRAIRDAGGTPYVRHLPDGAREYSSRDIAGIKATIHADGSMERTWSDGTVSREAAPTA
jgi:hypothetical protein